MEQIVRIVEIRKEKREKIGGAEIKQPTDILRFLTQFYDSQRILLLPPKNTETYGHFAFPNSIRGLSAAFVPFELKPLKNY